MQAPLQPTFKLVPCLLGLLVLVSSLFCTGLLLQICCLSMRIQLMHVFDAASLMQSCSIKLPMPSYHSGIISEAKCLVWLSTFILKIHSSLCRSCARLSALLICSVQFNMALVDIIERSATLSDRMLLQHRNCGNCLGWVQSALVAASQLNWEATRRSVFPLFTFPFLYITALGWWS